MSFLGGALDKLDPSERVRQHLTRDLELRRKDERSTQQFSAYAYRGSADLILRHGRFWSGRRLPERYEHLRGQGGECFWNALEAAEADPSLTYCEGVYTVGFGHAVAHAWCVDPDGGLVEVTFPTNADQIEARDVELGYRFLGPEHWGYYGVTFDTSLARGHATRLGFPMLDRSRAENATFAPGDLVVYTSRENYRSDVRAEQHDYPILKTLYDPNRKEL